jgi:hypothetical protein
MDKQVTISFRLAEDMLLWALDACHQGVGDSYKSRPGWHRYMSTWEEAEDTLPAFAEAIGAKWFLERYES